MLAEPGAEDRVREAEAVADDRGLLGFPVQPAVDCDRNFDRWDAPLDGLDDELRGVELLLAQDELRQHARTNSAVAVRAVGDVRAGHERHETVEERDAELARERARFGVAEDARAVRDVDSAA